VHAVGQWEAYNATYAALLPAGHQPAAELMFIDLGDTPRPWNPAELSMRVAAIWARGRIPSLDISLRGLQPTPDSLATLPDPLYGIDDDVAHTTQYDGRLADLVQLARSFGKPMMVRIGGEFNGWWNGYHPYEYPKAFRKIVTMFRDAGVTNVAFVWCYEPAAPDDFDAVNAAGEAKWFPGDDVLDWYSVDLFAAHDFSGPQGGHGSLSPFGRTLRFLDLAVAHRKPVVIAESSPMEFDLANPGQAAMAWDEWFVPYFALMTARTEIKWFHYINYDWTQASYYASQGWQNNDLGASSLVTQNYIAELAKSRYLHSSERGLLKDYTQ